MPDIESSPDRVLQAFHAIYEIRFRGLQKEMVVIFHQHPSMNAPARPPARLRKRFEKKAAVVIIQKNGFPAVSTCHHMLKSTGIFNSYATNHAGRNSVSVCCLKEKNVNCTLNPSCLTPSCRTCRSMVHHETEGKVDSWFGDFLGLGDLMLPTSLRCSSHDQEAAVFQHDGDFLPILFVPEVKATDSSKTYRRNIRIRA